MEPDDLVRITLRDQLVFHYLRRESPEKPLLKTAIRTAKKLIRMPVSASPKAIHHYEINLQKSIYNGNVLYGRVESTDRPPFLPLPPSSPEASILTPDKQYTTLIITDIPTPDKSPVKLGALVYLTNQKITSNGTIISKPILVHIYPSGEYSLYTADIQRIEKELNMPPLVRKPRTSSAFGASSASSATQATQKTPSVRSRVKALFDTLPPVQKGTQAAGTRLNALTVKELQAKCAKRGIQYTGLRKAELVAALSR